MSQVSVSAVKPRLRGVSHELAFYAAAVLGAYLVFRTRSDQARLGAAIYSTSMVLMFGISALYHRPNWSPKPRQILRRLDHTAIYLVLAGTATPVAILSLPEGSGSLMLWAVWIAAALGMSKSLFFLKAPKWVSLVVYVAVAAITFPFMPRIYEGVGATDTALFLAGMLLNGIGGLAYATKRPNPVPGVFGYHEVFHILVVVASALHYIAVQDIILR